LKLQSRFWLTFLLLASTLGLVGGPIMVAQSDAAAQTASAASVSTEKPHEENENDQFRHAPIVQAIARTLHLSPEATAEIFEDVNSAILIGLILFFLFKALPKAIRSRTATIQKQLIEARTATETANERLSAVEAKLARIGEDIDAIRRQTERDAQEDERRIKQSLEDEKQRIVKSAEQEIESAGATARRELKRFAAELSVDKAVQRIQLTAETDQALVERFGKELAGKFGNGGRN
jgi:F-type H+-transporting ATPase subunit b